MADEQPQLAENPQAGQEASEESLENPQIKVYDFDAIAVNLSALAGFKAAIVCDHDGEIIAENDRSAGQVNIADTADALFEIFREANISSKEMDIGQMLDGQIAGPWGRIFIKILEGKLVFTVCDSASKGADVQAKIDRILDSCSRLVDA